MVSNTVEFFDLFVVGFILSIIAVLWGLTLGQSAVILLAGGLGATLGALFWGRVADRIGRRPAFLWTVATFSTATGLCAAVPEGAWLLLALLRVVVGFGVGGLSVVDVPLISEFVPTKHRTRLAGLTVVFIPVGLFMGAQASALRGDTLGWRGLLLLGLVPVLLVFPIRLIVHESPRWLIQRGRLEEARANVAWYREIGAPIATLTRSAQRRWPWGSADPEVRARPAALARATIDHAADLGRPRLTGSPPGVRPPQRGRSCSASGHERPRSVASGENRTPRSSRWCGAPGWIRTSDTRFRSSSGAPGHVLVMALTCGVPSVV